MDVTVFMCLQPGSHMFGPTAIAKRVLSRGI